MSERTKDGQETSQLKWLSTGEVPLERSHLRELPGWRWECERVRYHWQQTMVDPSTVLSRTDKDFTQDHFFVAESPLVRLSRQLCRFGVSIIMCQIVIRISLSISIIQ
ncbi:hypothetical protein V3481_005238 [Fusarium oxysporum f. sp. vasinfectum]